MILAKFVRARTLVVGDAADMLAATLKWRAEMDIDAIMKEEFDQELFGRLGKVYGKDKAVFSLVAGLYKQVVDSLFIHYGLVAWSWQFGGRIVAKLGYGPEYEVCSKYPCS